jgi:Adenylyl/Guanylyl and SMODS C-terminal sensor domain
MADNRILIVDTLLRHIAEELDIPPSKYKQAVERYTAVGSWLEDGEYASVMKTPTIYTQGSFRLGTIVRPLIGGHEADYDIDLVCELSARGEDTSASVTKNSVGDRLKEHGTYKRMLTKEGRRCWTLLYAEDDGVGFHLDVLPCIPHPIVDASTLHGLKAVKITNRVGDSHQWGPSNPAGYADWFAERQRPVFSRVAVLRKTELQAQYPRVFARVEDVPDQLVRTPLQREIQILKRHRDARFAGHEIECDKPISIIININTLAALAYQQETDVFSTLADFLDQVQRFQDTGIITCVDNKWVIPNPVNKFENFADRWNDPKSHRSDAFFQWLHWVQEDIDDLLNAATPQQLDRRLRHAFGDRPGSRVAGKYSGPMPGAQQAPRSLFKRVAGSLLRFDVPHKQSPQWHITPTRHSASISAKYTRRGFRPTYFSSNSPPLPKGADLVFEAITDVPKPFKVHWQVVNTGGEAARAGQLRGDFYDSNKSGKDRTESTKFTGMHWVECFVVKDGVCVARSGEFVVNIG